MRRSRTLTTLALALAFVILTSLCGSAGVNRVVLHNIVWDVREHKPSIKHTHSFLKWIAIQALTAR